MKFVYDFGAWELAVLLIFVALYVAYMVRMYRIGRWMPVSNFFLAIKLTLRVFAFALLLFALLGPSWGENKREVQAVGKDIMMCVDLSKSMNSNDIQPSRLEKVKFELKKIINEFHSDRVGVIIFSSEAFLQCPLTYDRQALYMFVETMNTELTPNGGTDFRPPLKMALKKLTSEKETSDKKHSKIIILISDGEDFGEDTHKTVEDVADSGISLFTLGIGTEEGGRIPEGNGFKRDKNGREIISKLSNRALKNIASEGNGQYFEITNNKNEINSLIYSINQIEGEVKESRIVDASANVYFYFLTFSLFLLLVDLLVPLSIVKL